MARIVGSRYRLRLHISLRGRLPNRPKKGFGWMKNPGHVMSSTGPFRGDFRRIPFFLGPFENGVV